LHEIALLGVNIDQIFLHFFCENYRNLTHRAQPYIFTIILFDWDELIMSLKHPRNWHAVCVSYFRHESVRGASSNVDAQFSDCTNVAKIAENFEFIWPP
jgi:hypothetical protein